MMREPIDKNNWESCPSGLISQTAVHTVPPVIQQRKTLLWGTLAITMTLLLVSYSLIEAQPVTPDPSDTVSCQIVQRNLAAFCNNQINTVSLERSIGKHLIVCDSCRQKYRSICSCSTRCPNRKRNAVTKPCMKTSK